MNIADSVILITAAGCPLGKAASFHFSSLGARIALVDTDSERLHINHQECLAKGSECYALCLSDNKEATIANAINAVHEQYGKIDVLINCWLGIDIPMLLTQTSVEEFCQLMTEGTSAFLSFGKQTASYMREHHQSGVIINLAACRPDNPVPLSSSSKAMLAGFTQSWSKELAQYKIRVGGVFPLIFDERHDLPPSTLLSLPMQYEIARSAEYIVSNDYFNGRMIEAEVV
ncbi:SDR family oxidoreductase [Photobacterium halotolerans]|uniref:SDR family oxidoreductase n=1 Tax=Photobacterium halotolerans TaxID=265726 RepID=UPI00137377E4|nr:SDR family oxidoreductase [Photobacterium halotolerans]NAW87071.1 SDR family oxidoreductase [Photobacterium halotolerans]NAX48508.1 SDR family oxidoreductase [Photobacterium halotolerans]